MGRILFFLILAAVAYIFFKSWQRKQISGASGSSPREKVLHNPREVMYPCKHCGAYSPLSEGVMLQGRFYCGIEHAKLAGEKMVN